MRCCRRNVFAALTILVVAQGVPTSVASDDADQAPGASAAVESHIRVVRRAEHQTVSAYRASLAEAPPPQPGFRAAILGNAGMPWPYEPPTPSDAPELHRAADWVRAHLAEDGLLPTLAGVLERLGPANLNQGDQADLQLLRRSGLPVDLLAHFATPTPTGAGAYDVVRHVLGLIMQRRPSGAFDESTIALPFVPQKSDPNFRAMPESGNVAVEAFRVQLVRGDYWIGRGDGSSLDILRQLVEALPDVDVYVNVEQRFLDQFIARARLWPLRRPARLTAMPEPLTVSQWAQDNGKPGWLTDPAGRRGDSTDTSGATTRPALLVPRYASRGERESTAVPGDSFLADGLAAAGIGIVQSPLLFQGGNVMLVEDPQMGWRFLLLGEGEIHRNRALGLLPEQTVELFKTEFDAVECVVLPAASYHIDYELSVRAHDGSLIAFVGDSRAAAEHVLRLGIKALQTANVLSADAAATVRSALNRGDAATVLETLTTSLREVAVGPGVYPLSLATHFQDGLVDSGVGNLQRFLLAMDTLAALTPDWNDANADDAVRVYRESLRRREEDRRTLQDVLHRWNWKVVPVPSLADEQRGINYVNGIHGPGMYLMPAYGGFFAPLDAAARAAFEQALGPDVRVIPILTAESQRRVGALHCAVSVFGRPAETSP